MAAITSKFNFECSRSDMHLSGQVAELYLIYLEVALSNKRRSKKHGGFGCFWRQIGGGSKWVVVVQTP